MKYKQLFELEDFLSSNLCTYSHENIEEETTFENAFGKSQTAFFNEHIVQGLFIVVFAESVQDGVSLYNSMLLALPSLQEETSCFLDIDENGNLRLIIGVSETK